MSKVGVVYREPSLSKLYGLMRVQRVERQYFVWAAEGTFAYSAAVAKAIELKRRSQGALTPTLVRSS